MKFEYVKTKIACRLSLSSNSIRSNKVNEECMRDFSTPKHSVTNILKDAMYINGNKNVMLFLVKKNIPFLNAAETIMKLHECRKLD